MSEANKFCIFILSHGRPNNVKTLRTLERCNWNGKTYIVIDDEDKTADRYKSLYGEKVIQFSKEEYSHKFDEGDNFKDRRTITYARNACFDIAENLGYKYFLQLDDDYTSFMYRFHIRDTTHQIANLTFERSISELLNFYIKTPCLSIAIAQGGDYLGGNKDRELVRTRRKCMNSFFCSTERRFQFRGRFNEDVNTYVTLGRQGHLFLTIMPMQLNQSATQSSGGGISDLYKKYGTYVKAHTTVCHSPSCVKIGVIGDRRSPHFRIHHKINVHAAYPMIIDEKWRKSTPLKPVKV
jgi:hypothetical protein